MAMACRISIQEVLRQGVAAGTRYPELLMHVLDG
jgi:hypothetical protein